MNTTMRITLLAALCLALALVAGCSAGADDPTASSASSAPTALPDSDTVVLTVDGLPVFWPEFKFWLKNVTNYYKALYKLDEITDWSVQQNGLPLTEFLRSSAATQAARARAIEAQAAERGLGLSEGERAAIAEERQKNISIYGSESEYLRIVAGMYYSEKVYTYLEKIDYLTLDLFTELYGKDGEKCTDEEVLAYAAEQGLMSARYIFLSNIGEDGSELSAEAKAEKRALLEDLVSRLDLSADPLTLFDSLVDEYNEDTELLAYPDGRLFAPGVMGAGFESACAALSENRYSGVLETAEGLYLILRLPVYPDMAADSSGNTLRYRTAYDYLFQGQLEDWVAGMDIEYEDVYDQIRVEGLFE